MAYTFLKALGHHIGTSLVEDDQLDYAKKIYGSGKLVLPVDNVVAAAYPEDESATGKVVNSDEIPDGMMGLDIGPKTAEIMQNHCFCKDCLLEWTYGSQRNSCIC